MKTPSSEQLPSEIVTRLFQDDGFTPNNQRLPLVILRGTGAREQKDAAAWLEQRFISHGWSSTWRWTVYPYHHYHSTNHEVLGVSRGTARLMLGGEAGEEFRVSTGDVIIIPSGVAHKCLDSTDDFQVVGAYPGGHEPDLIVSGEGDISAARQRIARLPVPEFDPVYGKDGPLTRHWKS